MTHTPAARRAAVATLAAAIAERDAAYRDADNADLLRGACGIVAGVHRMVYAMFGEKVGNAISDEAHAAARA